MKIENGVVILISGKKCKIIKDYGILKCNMHAIKIQTENNGQMLLIKDMKGPAGSSYIFVGSDQYYQFPELLHLV